MPVGKKPMIQYPIEQLTGAGIREILIVTGREHMGDVVNLLGSGIDFGCNFTYKVQDMAGGIAQALGLAEHFAGGDSIVVLLGDNVFGDDLSGFIKRFDKQKAGAKVLIKEVSDPERFGVAEIKGKKIVSIEEKPKRPKSKFAVTGIYMYDNRVFEIIRKLKPSGRGELEISDVNSAYLKKGELEYEVLPGYWTDAGTFDTLEKASKLVEGEGGR